MLMQQHFSYTDGSVSMDLSYPGNQPLGYYAAPGTVVTIEVGQEPGQEEQGRQGGSQRGRGGVNSI